MTRNSQNQSPPPPPATRGNNRLASGLSPAMLAQISQAVASAMATQRPLPQIQDPAERRLSDQINIIAERVRIQSVANARAGRVLQINTRFQSNNFTVAYLNGQHHGHQLNSHHNSCIAEDTEMAISKLNALPASTDTQPILDILMSVQEAAKKQKVLDDFMAFLALQLDTVNDPRDLARVLRDRISAEAKLRLGETASWDEDFIKGLRAWLKEAIKNALNLLDNHRLCNSVKGGNGGNNKRSCPPAAASSTNPKKGRGANKQRSQTTSASLGGDAHIDTTDLDLADP